MLGPLHYAAFAAGFVVCGGLAGLGGWAYDNLVDDPAVVRETKAGCAAEASRAAMEATIAQRARDLQKMEEMQREFDAIMRQRAAGNAQVQRELEDEIRAFETSVGSACSVTVDNLDFLQP